jgi:hypothetical protein
LDIRILHYSKRFWKTGGEQRKAHEAKILPLDELLKLKLKALELAAKLGTPKDNQFIRKMFGAAEGR